jgi:hypothetical protein
MQGFDLLLEKYKNEIFIRGYENFHSKKYPQIQDVNGLPFHFDPTFKRIGLSLSGGADSTLLFYILCKTIKDTNSDCKIFPITMIRFFDSKPWLPKSAKDVYTWMQERFSDIVDEHIWGFIPPDLEVVTMKNLQLPHLDKRYRTDLMFSDVLCTMSYNEYLLISKNLDYIYSGNTMNPPENFDRAPEFRNEHVIEKEGITNVIGGAAINPFTLITKDWIMAQYQNFELEDLLKLTRSCEADIRVLGDMWSNIKDEQPPACGFCFFCKERQWGIDNSEKFLIAK